MARRGRFGKYGELKRKARLRASRISRAKGSRSKLFFPAGPRKRTRRRAGTSAPGEAGKAKGSPHVQ